MASPLDVGEAKTLLFWRDVLSELMATFYMMIFVVFAFVTLDRTLYAPSTPLVGLMVGLAIFLLIEGYRPFSGGHLNPGVSFAAAIAGRISIIRAVCYTLGQCTGSILASLLVLALTPASAKDSIVAFVPNKELEAWQAVGVEAVLMFNLVFVALSVTEVKNKNRSGMPGLICGFNVGTAVMAAGTYTGVCINPSVALGPAVAARNFHMHWVYWVGDYTGALLAVLCFKLFWYLQDRQDRLTSAATQRTPSDDQDKIGFTKSRDIPVAISDC